MIMDDYIGRAYSSPLATSLMGVAGAVIVLLSAATLDYRAWVALGTGGTPPNIKGYLKITKFRFLRAISPDSLRDASRLSKLGPSYITGQLRQRKGPRPSIVGRTLPQRQHPAPLEPSIRERLHDLPRKYATKFPDLLNLDLSSTEGRSTDAIYSKVQGQGRAQDRVLGNEIAHVHPSENSLHLWLTSADARKVVEAGWGERFPLSSLGMTHEGWTFVYAPISTQDVDVIEVIFRAAIGHLTGENVE